MVEKEKDKNVFVDIAAVCGGISVAMIAIIVIFASSHAWTIPIVVAAMALMGIVLGYFASKKK